MPKTTYWISDGYGAKAQVTGVEERDRWLPLGWAEADEPGLGDRVWLAHEEHGGRALFPAEAAELWQARGWQPTSPPPDPDALPPADPAGSKTEAETAPAPSAKTKEK